MIWSVELLHLNLNYYVIHFTLLAIIYRFIEKTTFVILDEFRTTSETSKNKAPWGSTKYIIAALVMQLEKQGYSPICVGNCGDFRFVIKMI